MITQSGEDDFQSDYEAAIGELGAKVKHVTFTSAGVASGDDTEVYYTAFIEY